MIYFQTGADEGHCAFFHDKEAPSGGGKTREIVGFGVLVQKFRDQPAMLDTLSVLMEVHEKTPDEVSGYMVFPERADFVYQGSLPEMLAEIKTLRGSRAIFGFENFTFSRV